MDYKECVTIDDCAGPDVYCQNDTELNARFCYCFKELQRSRNPDGSCRTADDVQDVRKDTFILSEFIDTILPGKNTSSSIHHRQNVSNSTAVKEQKNGLSDPMLTLQIAIPLLCVLFVVLALTIIIYRRTQFCRRKRRKEAAIKTTEDEQLLDRMNIVSKNPAYFTALNGNSKEKHFDIIEIPIGQVKIIEAIGEGAFGQVYRGTRFNDNGEEISKVAIKVLKEGVSNEVRDDFEREVEIMSAFDHVNILNLLGVVTKDNGETPYMIFEYMVHGDLAELLRKNDISMRKAGEECILQRTNLVDIAIQIANGMTYLTSQHFVHRDLATRNCLVGEGLVVKISDFGMARDVYTCDYYRIGGSRMLPVRWMSPESVKYGRFTTESDIWAFGVVLWEIFSFGRQPYYGHSNEEVVRFLDEGILLQRPEECPSTVYHVMLGCWKTDPKERLMFSKIHKHLTDYSQTFTRNIHHPQSSNSPTFI